MQTIDADQKIPTSKESSLELVEVSSKLITFKELSIFLGRSEDSLRYHFKKGRFTASAKFGRSYAFVLDDVLKQLQRGIKKTYKY